MKANAQSSRTPSPAKAAAEKSPKRGNKSENSSLKSPTSSCKASKISGKGNDTIVKQEENYLARCTNFRLTTGYEVSICNCKHIRKIRIGERHSICNPQRWLCNTCLTTESVWACLSCPNVACGRFIKEHALTHFQEFGHPLVIDVNELYVYCYKCDDYVLNDNNSSDIKVLRETLLAIRYQNFTGTTRSGHTLRSAMITEQEDLDMRRQMQQEQLDRDDRLFTAIWHSRFVRQRKAFRHWIRYIRWRRTLDAFTRDSEEDDEVSDVESSVTETTSDSVEEAKDATISDVEQCPPALPPSPKIERLDEEVLDQIMNVPTENIMNIVDEKSETKDVDLPLPEEKPPPQSIELESQPETLPEENKPIVLEVCVPTDLKSASVEVEDVSSQFDGFSAETSLVDTEVPTSSSQSDGVSENEPKEDESAPVVVDASTTLNRSSEEVTLTPLNILSRPKRSNAAARYKEIFNNLISPLVVKREPPPASSRTASEEPPRKRRSFSGPPPSGRRSDRIKQIAVEKKLAEKKGKASKRRRTGARLTKRKYERDRRAEPRKRKRASSKVTNRKRQPLPRKTSRRGSMSHQPLRARRLISGTSERKRVNSYRPPSLYDNIPNKAVTSLIPGVTGLRNLGNTCYLNSIIQVLGHLQKFRLCLLALREIEFRESFLSDSSAKEFDDGFSFSTPQGRAVRSMARRSTIELYNEQNKPTTPVKSSERMRSGLNGGQSPTDNIGEALPLSPTRVGKRSSSTGVDSSTWSSSLSLCNELDHLYQVMWSGKWKLVSPYHFLHSVWSLIPSFRGYTQQDAQEFLCELLDKIVSELERCHSKSKPENNLALRILQVVQKVFEGRLMSRVRCLECEQISSTVEPFWDLSLEFPERYHKITSKRWSSTRPPAAPSDPCTLHEMLQNFTSPETLDGGKVYGCTKCNFLQQHKTTVHPASPGKKRQLLRRNSQCLTEAEKQLKVLDLPQVLRFHLKRFRWIGRNHREKIAVHVEFPSELDMRPYCWNSENETSNIQYMYDLSAVVMHHGRGFGSGHYTANCWNDIGEFWVHCNDSNLELRSIEDVMGSQAYILFYTQRGLDPQPHILSPPTTPRAPSPVHLSPTPPSNKEEVEEVMTEDVPIENQDAPPT